MFNTDQSSVLLFGAFLKTVLWSCNCLYNMQLLNQYVEQFIGILEGQIVEIIKDIPGLL